MKRLKKIFSFLFVAFIATMTIVSPVNALKSTSTTTGSITINNAVKGEDYSLYQKMLIIAELSMISETIFTILPQSSYPSKTLNCLTNG